MNRARHAAGIPLLPVLPTLPAPPLVVSVTLLYSISCSADGGAKSSSEQLDPEPPLSGPSILGNHANQLQQALTSASQIRTLSPADADAWAHYYLGAECDPARAPDAILAAVGVL